jgi:aspartyl-tRNA(Asn)/glutamyl-tRNA(Gln) amidotransferase subunit C
MQVNKELISRLEKLARLQLTETERAQFAGDLTRILEMVDKLRELDTTGVEPLAYPTLAETEWREDVVGAQLTPSEALKNAPKHDGQFFRVPKIIE